MKKPIMILSMLAMALLVTFSACNKDDDDDDDTLMTPTEYLTAHSWLTTSVEISPGLEIVPGVVVIDDLFEDVTLFGETYSATEPCDRDDLVYFNTDGTVTEDAGAIKCNDDDPQQVDAGNWALSDDGLTITMSSTLLGVEEDLSGQISTLDNNNFVVTVEVTIDLGLGLGETDYTLTIHMVK